MRTTKRHGRGGFERAVKGSVHSRNNARQDDDDDDGATLRRSSDISALKTGPLRMLKPSAAHRPNVCTGVHYMHESAVCVYA